MQNILLHIEMNLILSSNCLRLNRLAMKNVE